MRGLPKYNFPAFDEARDRFKKKGWVVTSPADLDREVGIDENTNTLPDNYLDTVIQRDLTAVTKCAAIALLPGWDKSEGAQLELHLARVLKRTVYDAVTEKPFNEAILQEAFRITRGDRQDDYGHPLDEHGIIADFWSTHLGFPVTAVQVAECMVLLKLARNRHRRKRDNWVDIAGYADCGHRIIEETERRANIKGRS